MTQTPDARPHIDRLGEAHGAALALAQGGAPTAAVIEYLLVAMQAAYALAAGLDATRADLIRLSGLRGQLPVVSLPLWDELQLRYGVGRDPAADRRWLEAYEELQAAQRAGA